jgi:hypothetical protein
MPAAGPSSSIRSEAFLKGYNACAAHISRTHNPYLKYPQDEASVRKADDWHDGWNTRFHGESIYEGEPDP